MTGMRQECRTEDIAAFLDGELDGAACESFERHLEECSACAGNLLDQKRFLCELDIALNEEQAPSLPVNFVKVVAVNAQSDMRGVRSTVERTRALWLCAVLAVVSLIVLGATARDFVLAFFRPLASIGGFVWHTVYGVGAGATIISRPVGGHFVLESEFFGIIAFVLFVAALTLLPRLISRYHRAQS